MTGPGTATAWVGHLRAGGTTPWQHWRTEEADLSEKGRPEEARPTPAPLPGAQQLELLRRLNEITTPGPALADRVLSASAWGRGLPDLPLLGVGESRFGPRPVDPGALPVAELLRVATLMVADALATHEEPPAAPPTSRLHHWRRGYRLVGDPWQADQLRDTLRRQGRPPGGRRPRVLVLSGPVDRLLADAWTRRCFTHGAPPWPAWLAQHSGRALPAGADTARAADAWRARVGARRVTVVTDAAAVPRLVGVRTVEPALRIGPDGVELARQVAQALEVAVVPDRRPGLLFDVLRPAVAALCPAGDLAVPDEHRAWARRRAARQRRRLLAAGYAVAGGVDALLPAQHQPPGQGEPRLPQGDGVLRLAGQLLAGGLTAPDGAAHATSTGGRRS